MYSKIITQLIEKSGLSLGELSRRSGVPKSTLANWKRGYEPSAAKLGAVLNALGFELIIQRKETP